MPSRSTRIACLSLVALLVLCFGLAAYLGIWFQTWAGNRSGSANLMTVLLGDSRRMFANHFFKKADAYFHSGYYPTVFDNQQAYATPHVAADTGTVEEKNRGDEHVFLGKPQDWIDAFSRNFFPSSHTHLDEGGTEHAEHGEHCDHATHTEGKGGSLADSSEVREILPWIELSATLDPKDIRNYTVAAYWLRERMHKVAEAEQYLRQGLRANPGAYEILYELGRVYAENHHDPERACNLWRAALKSWRRINEGKPREEQDIYIYNEIVAHLAKQEQQQGNYDEALKYMELWKAASPHPEAVEQQIQELKKEKLAPHAPHPE